ncbi:MAG: 30S ribosomal protein S6 [Spirochaetales bacterium]|nr:30S ribosomal protein S6 [Spirochaetales bacterium]
MRNYEAVFIFLPEDESYKSGLEAVKEELKKAEAVISKEDDMGTRELAYPIKKETRAHYYCFYAEIKPEAIIGIEKAVKLNKNVLKYLFVRKDD